MSVNNEAKLLIVTTLFNPNEFLSRTLQSILEQTKTKNIIHYIYDDGSTKNFDVIINEYIEMVNKLSNPYKVIYEKGIKNLGVDKAHEYAFYKTKEMDYEFFTWLDSGDYYSKDYIENAFKIIESKKYDCIHNDYYEYFPEKKEISKNTIGSYLKKRKLKMENQLYNYVFFNNFHYGHFVVRKDLLLKVNPNFTIYNCGLHYDDQLILEMVFSNYKFKYLSNIKSYVMVCKDSAGLKRAKKDDSFLNNYSFLLDLYFAENTKQFITDIFNAKKDGSLLAEMTKSNSRNKKYKEAYKSFKNFFKKYKIKKTYHPYYWKYVIKYILLNIL